MVVIFIRLVYHDATLVRLELEVTDTILLDVLHHTEGHGVMGTGTLVHSLGSMNLSPIIHLAAIHFTNQI